MGFDSLDTNIQQKIQQWLSDQYDAETRTTLQNLIDEQNHNELTDAFYTDLAFGTGGMRGVMGVGSNRINKYTLGKATQGFSNYLRKSYPGEQVKVAIAHDSRNNSKLFAGLVADVFSANDIYVYFFDGLRPTPELSFAIRELGCKGGVMLTASHNPKEYNGYKAYGADGGQLVNPHDVNVMTEVSNIEQTSEIKFAGNPENIEMIGEAMDQRYLDELAKLSIAKEAIQRQKNLKIVFSPIHGTGAVMVPPVLERFGFENVHTVEEQMVADGNFPTVVYPNPEEVEAMTMAMEKAAAIDADLVMATDPDADRVGMAVKNDSGEFAILNGNQTAVLLFNYMLNAWEEAGKITGKEYIVKTIVTTYLCDKIAKSKGVACYNTLTGFKHIGEMMTRLEGKETFITGGEESFGLLVGEHARDKDAVISCAMLAEMTAYYKDQGSSISEVLKDIYLEYGFYKEKLVAITKKGKSGAEEIAAILDKLRNNPPTSLAGSKITVIKDYQTQVAKNIETSAEETITLPKSNVLQFFTADGSIVSARPSGTEPKIKFYCSVNEPLATKEEYASTEIRLDAKIEALMGDLI